MFGLPVGTALLVFAFPVFWIVYTIIFLVVTRNWNREESEDRAP
jgi:hypothetical protein